MRDASILKTKLWNQVTLNLLFWEYLAKAKYIWTTVYPKPGQLFNKSKETMDNCSTKARKPWTTVHQNQGNHWMLRIYKPYTTFNNLINNHHPWFWLDKQTLLLLSTIFFYLENVTVRRRCDETNRVWKNVPSIMSHCPTLYCGYAKHGLPDLTSYPQDSKYF